jgi:hypothetical protein
MCVVDLQVCRTLLWRDTPALNHDTLTLHLVHLLHTHTHTHTQKKKTLTLPAPPFSSWSAQASDVGPLKHTPHTHLYTHTHTHTHALPHTPHTLLHVHKHTHTCTPFCSADRSNFEDQIGAGQFADHVFVGCR